MPVGQFYVAIEATIFRIVRRAIEAHVSNPFSPSFLVIIGFCFQLVEMFAKIMIKWTMMAVGGETFHIGASLLDDIGQQDGSNLFGLEMTGFDEKDVGMTEPTVVMHFSREEGFGSQCFGFGDEVAA